MAVIVAQPAAVNAALGCKRRSLCESLKAEQPLGRV
jgi:hypothetical protein